MTISLITKTYHSTILFDSSACVIVKRSNHEGGQLALERWRKEVSTLKHIGTHPNIVEFLDEHDPIMSYTMSIAPGQALSSYSPAALSPHIHDICLQLSGALSHIHAQGIVHDDVKPDNIMFLLGPSPNASSATLIDFGACIEIGQFTLSGTPWYMAPEYIRKVKGPKTDVWALDVTIAWALGVGDEAEMVMMVGWLNVVGDAREKLRLDSTIVPMGRLAEGSRVSCVRILKDAVIKMLDPDPVTRIETSETVDRLRV